MAEKAPGWHVGHDGMKRRCANINNCGVKAQIHGRTEAELYENMDAAYSAAHPNVPLSRGGATAVSAPSKEDQGNGIAYPLNHPVTHYGFTGEELSGDEESFGNARVFGNAQAPGDEESFGNARVFGNAQAPGNAEVFGNARASGDARVYRDGVSD